MPNQSGEKKSLRAAHKDLTRRRILDAARTLFSSGPFEEVSIEDVAKAAGVGRTTIYFHYATKNHLVIDLLQEDWNRQAVVFERLVPPITIDTLGAWLVTVADGMRRSKKLMRLFSFALSISEDFNDLLFQHRERLVQILSRVHPAFVAHGAKDMDSRMAAAASHMIVIQIEYYATLAISNLAPEDAEATRQVMLQNLWGFIGSSPSGNHSSD